MTAIKGKETPCHEMEVEINPHETCIMHVPCDMRFVFSRCGDGVIRITCSSRGEQRSFSLTEGVIDLDVQAGHVILDNQCDKPYRIKMDVYPLDQEGA